jgi:hypothetical protein
MPLLLYLWGKSPQYLLDRRLGLGLRAGLDAMENGKNPLPLLKNEPQFNDHPAYSLLLYYYAIPYLLP